MSLIRDHNPSRRTPWVTWALIIVNVAVFLAYMPLLEDETAFLAFLDRWALIPARLSAGACFETVFTSMFLHAGLLCNSSTHRIAAAVR